MQSPSGLEGSLVAFTSRRPRRDRPELTAPGTRGALLHPSVPGTFGKALGLQYFMGLWGQRTRYGRGCSPALTASGALTLVIP